MRTLRITLTAAIALAGLTACAPTRVEGVWHFYLSLSEGSDCTQDLDLQRWPDGGQDD